MKKTMIFTASLFLVLSASAAILTALPSESWEATKAKLLATDLHKKPYSIIETKKGMDARLQILTPWALAAEAAQRAVLSSGPFSQADAEAILSQRKIVIRALLVTFKCPLAAQARTMIRFREGENVVFPISESSKFNPQGSQYDQYMTEVEAVFDLEALNKAEQNSKLSLKDMVTVNCGPGMVYSVGFHYKDLE